MLDSIFKFLKHKNKVPLEFMGKIRNYLKEIILFTIMKNKKLMTYMVINLLSILTLIFVILLFEKNFILTFLLILIGLVMLFILKSLKKVTIFFSCGIMGAISEIIAVSNGVWTYSNPNSFGIPLWLIPLWGIAAIFMINFQEQLSQLKITYNKFKKK